MSLLDRYISSIFFKNLLLVLAALVGIYLLIDFIEKVDNFLEAGEGVAATGRYLLLKVPLISEQIMPVCLLLAVIITFGSLSHNREILAMQAGGIRLIRTIAPLVLAAVAICLLMAAAAQWLTPASTRATNRIWYEEVKNEKARGTVIRGLTFHRGSEGIYAFRRTGEKNLFRDFSYVSRDERGKMRLFIAAGEARWLGDRWLLTRLLIQEGDQRPHFLRQSELPLPDRPEDFFQPPYHLDEQSLSTLLAERGRDRGAALTLQKRLSYIFLGLPLIFLGLPLLILFIRRYNIGLAIAIPASCVLAFIAWGGWSFAIAAAAGRTLPPALFAWSIHLLCLSAGIFIFRWVER